MVDVGAFIGKKNQNKHFALRVLLKRRGAEEHALKMIAEVGDVFKKVTKKAMGK